MKKAFGEYQRLARSALGFSSVWLGEDHLLYVKGSGFLIPFSEEYKRFRYREIQSLVVARTSGVWLGAIGYLAGLAITAGIGFGMLFAREPGDVGFLVATLAIPLPLAVLMLGLLIRHLVLGPHCLFEVQTGLKRERLAAVNRLHASREVSRRLGEKIRSAQIDLIPAEADTGFSPSSLSRSDEILRIPRPTLMAFAVQALAAICLLILLHVSSTILAGLMIVVSLIGIIPLLISLASSIRRPAPDVIRQLLWLQLVGSLIIALTAAVYYIDQAINDPALTVDVFGPLEAFASLSALGGFAFYLIFLVIGLAHLGIGAGGLIQTRRWRDRLGPEPSPQTPTQPDLPTEA